MSKEAAENHNTSLYIFYTNGTFSQWMPDTSKLCLSEWWSNRPARRFIWSKHFSPILPFRLGSDLTQNRSLDHKRVSENGMAKAIPLLLQLCSVLPQDDWKFSKQIKTPWKTKEQKTKQFTQAALATYCIKTSFSVTKQALAVADHEHSKLVTVLCETSPSAWSALR